MTDRYDNRWQGACATLVAALLALSVASDRAAALDLEAAWRLAQERDPTLAAAEAQRRADLEQVPQARALLLPQISASGSATRIWEDIDVDWDDVDGGGDEPQLPVAGLAGERRYTTADIGIDLRQALFRRDAFIALRQARVVEDQAELAFSQARQRLALQLAEAYFGVLQTSDAVRTFEAELAAVRAEHDRAQRRFELGTGAALEVNDARARLAATRAALLQARSERVLARETLRRIVAEPFDELVALAPDFTPQRPVPAAMDEWTVLANARNLDVRLAEHALEIARATVDAARAGRYPQLDLIASVRRDQQGDAPFAGGIGLETDRALIGIQLSMELFAGGGIRAEIRRSVARREAALHELDAARRGAAIAAESAYIGLEGARERVAALEEALEAARLAETSAERGLELGQRTMLDLLLVRRERFDVERNLDAARYAWLLAYLELHAAIGAPMDEVVETVNAMLVPRTR